MEYLCAYVRKYVQDVYTENSKVMIKKSRKMTVNGDIDIVD
jgi:hypothetical protein